MKRRARVSIASETAPPFELDIIKRGFVQESVVEYAKEKILHAARAAPRRVLFARLKLTHEPHRSVERPAIAEVMLDLDGLPVRAHVAARDLREASDLLEQRLRRKLKDIEHFSEFLRTFTGVPEPGEWRHGDQPAHRPAHFPRRPEERQVVRRKTFTLGRLTPAAAAFEMEMLDYDFHLFLETDTGQDAVILRLADGGYELMRVSPARGEGSMGIPVSSAEPPLMHLAEAVQRLNESGEPFAFFVDAVTQRGNVLYRRYDGHYGLIAPAEPLVEPSPAKMGAWAEVLR